MCIVQKYPVTELDPGASGPSNGMLYFLVVTDFVVLLLYLFLLGFDVINVYTIFTQKRTDKLILVLFYLLATVSILASIFAMAIYFVYDVKTVAG
jgi:hypothetical protein